MQPPILSSVAVTFVPSTSFLRALITVCCPCSSAVSQTPARAWVELPFVRLSHLSYMKHLPLSDLCHVPRRTFLCFLLG